LTPPIEGLRIPRNGFRRLERDRDGISSQAERGSTSMRNEFTAIVERDGDWFIAYCPEIPGANGQGRTEDECLKSLSEAIALILDDRRQDALRGTPEGAVRHQVVVGQ
jgi:predicted RNase H-like HicB family nuclease